jgi:hypothetical protein
MSYDGFEILSNAFDIVAREGTEEAGTLAGAYVPTVVALFQHADHVAFLQFKLVIILRCIRVKRSVSESNKIFTIKSTAKLH